MRLYQNNHPYVCSLVFFRYCTPFCALFCQQWSSRPLSIVSFHALYAPSAEYFYCRRSVVTLFTTAQLARRTWMHTQSNITNIIFTWVHNTNTHKMLLIYFIQYTINQTSWFCSVDFNTPNLLKNTTKPYLTLSYLRMLTWSELDPFSVSYLT
jgi:hypothetical protein